MEIMAHTVIIPTTRQIHMQHVQQAVQNHNIVVDVRQRKIQQQYLR